MELIKSSEAKKILGIKNYGTFLHHLLYNGFSHAETKIIDNRFYKLYSKKDIIKLKKILDEKKNR